MLIYGIITIKYPILSYTIYKKLLLNYELLGGTMRLTDEKNISNFIFR